MHRISPDKRTVLICEMITYLQSIEDTQTLYDLHLLIWSFAKDGRKPEWFRSDRS